MLSVGQNDAARLLRGQAVLIRGRDAPTGAGADLCHLQGTPDRGRPHREGRAAARPACSISATAVSLAESRLSGGRFFPRKRCEFVYKPAHPRGAVWLGALTARPGWTTSRPLGRSKLRPLHRERYPMSLSAERKLQVVKEYATKTGRYGLAGGADRASHRAHQRADGALQAPQEGQSFAARPAQDGELAPSSPRPRQIARTRGATRRSSSVWESAASGRIVRRGSRLTLPLAKDRPGDGDVGRLPSGSCGA